jgi:hypothetical protein
MITKEEAKEKTLNSIKLAKKYKICITEYEVEKVLDKKYRHIKTICKHDDREIIAETAKYIIESFGEDYRCENNKNEETKITEYDEYTIYTIYLLWS